MAKAGGGGRRAGGKTVRESEAYHHGDLREALLAAAESMLLEQGVERFTLRECARRAGVSHGAPAHHFGDARGLLSEFSALSFERLDALMGVYRQRSEPDAYAQFAATGLAYVDFALANRARFQLMFRSDRLDYRNERLSAAGARVYAHLVETVTAMRPDHARGETPREHIAFAWSIAHGVATLMLDNRTFAELVGNRPEHAHAMMRELLHRARPFFEGSSATEASMRAAGGD